MHFIATLAMDSVNLKLAELHVETSDQIFEFVLILSHKFHSLFLVHFLSEELFWSLMVREQQEEDVALVSRYLHQVDLALNLMKVAIKHPSHLWDTQLIPTNIHAAWSFFGYDIREARRRTPHFLW
jgi:hypothetical protein